ncbi:MAG: hypothetical protein ACOX22_01425 [Caldicoprobacterales bacterium]
MAEAQKLTVDQVPADELIRVLKAEGADLR